MKMNPRAANTHMLRVLMKMRSAPESILLSSCRSCTLAKLYKQFRWSAVNQAKKLWGLWWMGLFSLLFICTQLFYQQVVDSLLSFHFTFATIRALWFDPIGFHHFCILPLSYKLNDDQLMWVVSKKLLCESCVVVGGSVVFLALLNFPTHDFHSEVYDSSSKARIPSWRYRIVYMERGLSYVAYNRRLPTDEWRPASMQPSH